MTEQQFTYWLQGFAELSGDTPPTKAQWKSIREHLATVFVKVTPKIGGIPQWIPQTSDASKMIQPLRTECTSGPNGVNNGCGSNVIC
jgi:hypothetical protein